MPSATIKIFSSARRPKETPHCGDIELDGKAVAGPRSEFDGVLAREESEGSGVYFLTGSDPDSGKPTLYIGEAECIRDRIKAHLQKDFWNHVIYFVSKDENLTKAHIRYLEGKLIETRQAGRAVVNNGQGSGAKLPESDRADIYISGR